jgi:hypothetical protein
VKREILLCLLLAVLLGSCQHLFTYGLPDADTQKRFPAEKIKWEYDGATVTKITVVGDDNKLYRLNITPKTKLEATTIYGEVYTFYLQGIKVDNAAGLTGDSKSWTGYELHDHAVRTVYIRDISKIQVISDNQAGPLDL